MSDGPTANTAAQSASAGGWSAISLKAPTARTEGSFRRRPRFSAIAISASSRLVPESNSWTANVSRCQDGLLLTERFGLDCLAASAEHMFSRISRTASEDIVPRLPSRLDGPRPLFQNRRRLFYGIVSPCSVDFPSPCFGGAGLFFITKE
jgi:hypothetical protein